MPKVWRGGVLQEPKKKTGTAARVTQYDDVRMCAKADIPMESESVAKVQNSTSGYPSVFVAILFLLLVVWFIAAMFRL